MAKLVNGAYEFTGFDLWEMNSPVVVQKDFKLFAYDYWFMQDYSSWGFLLYLPFSISIGRFYRHGKLHARHYGNQRFLQMKKNEYRWMYAGRRA